MFRKIIRNPKQILSAEECISILKKSSSGVLNVLGDDDYPYGVPMSYVLKDNKIYFHCAHKGHRMDSLKKHNKVSFTVIETDNIVSEEYTTYFRSVIAFGKATIIEDIEEKRQSLIALVDKYSADFMEGGKKEIEAKVKGVCVFRIDIEHLSGKESIEFAEAR